MKTDTTPTHSNKRSVNHSPVNPMSDLITVNIIDWTKINKEITDSIHELHPDLKDNEYEASENYNGVIIHNGHFLLIERDLTAEIANNGKVSVNVLKKSKDPRVMIISPSFTVKIAIEDIQDSFTGEKLLLPDYMGERYQYNSRIASNEINLLKFLNKKTK